MSNSNTNLVQHWLKVDWKKHPQADSWKQDDIEEQIFMTGIEHGSLVTRGSWFAFDSEKKQKDMFFRATFAAAPNDQIELAIQRFGDAIREVFQLQKTNGVNGTV
jgi:aromatic amino acid aminotransferase I / 2-aminoadipate transaminase